jgi:hypothetical protein
MVMDVLENVDKFPTNWVAPEGYRNKGITTNRVVSAVTSSNPVRGLMKSHLYR